MNVMPFASVALAAATLFAASGCAAQSVLCSEKPSSGPVYIQVALVNDVPSATPKVCYVQPGAQVSWISDSKPFALRFKRSSPGGSNAPKDPSSSPSSNGKQMLSINAAAPEGSYDYGITIDGKYVDPAVIIKRAQ
jgi:hypothetical protein